MLAPSEDYWVIPQDWPGETAYIVAGGPSAGTQPLHLLADRLVIAVNCSWAAVPRAQYLFFGDSRWWQAYRRELLQWFHGCIVTCSDIRHERVLRLRKLMPPQLASDPSSVTMRRTSLSGAISLAIHLGARRLVLLGADGKPSADGAMHHHAPHPWPQRRGCWKEQTDELVALSSRIADRGITVVNASPGSALKCWPVVTLEQAIGGQ